MENNKKRKAMKKHNFNETIYIFKLMYEGWSVVDKKGKKHQIYGIDLTDGTVHLNLGHLKSNQISHIEQTLPMNGDEVFAWSIKNDTKFKGNYVGKHENKHLVHCWLNSEIRFFDLVKLAKEPRQLTIEQVTEMLNVIVN